jgi:hypothetical protein
MQIRIPFTICKRFGLKIPSVIRVHKMATLEKDMMETVMGQIDETVSEKVKSLYI